MDKKLHAQETSSSRPDENLSRLADGCLKVGSRKSELALIQTRTVINRLQEFYSNNDHRLRQLHESKTISTSKLNFDVVAISTTGDQVLDKPLPAIGAKSLFTKELEIALIDGRIDFIVHSLKDLPTTLPEGCVVGAVMKRDCPEDSVVLSSSLKPQVQPLNFLFGECADPAARKPKVGTSSQRRISMIKRCNPSIECIDIRGNLNTRIAKLDSVARSYDAIILAKAGLDRMGWSERSSCLLKPENHRGLGDWFYAVGQGAVAVECRAEDTRVLEILRPIVDVKTTYEVIAERALMKKLEGGCSVPLGVRSSWLRKNGREVLALEGIVLSLDGQRKVRADGQSTLETEGSELVCRSGCLGLDLTTGITIARTTPHLSTIQNKMMMSAELGTRVADNMVELGCLKLLGRRM